MKFFSLFLAFAISLQVSAEESGASGAKLQVYLVVREVTIPAKKADEIGFDWLLSDKPAVKAPRRAFGDISGVFTNPQLQLMLRALKKKVDAEIVTAPSLMVRPEQSGLLQVAKSRSVAVIPTIKADEVTIDLEIDLSQFSGRPMLRKPSTEVTIWDGQTAVLNAGKRFGKHRAVFVTAQICDPTGMPVGKSHPGID